MTDIVVVCSAKVAITLRRDESPTEHSQCGIFLSYEPVEDRHLRQKSIHVDRPKSGYITAERDGYYFFTAYPQTNVTGTFVRAANDDSHKFTFYSG